MLINLTSHPVAIILHENRSRETIPALAQEPARVRRRQVRRGAPALLQGEGYPAVVLETFINPPLPKPRPGVWLLVSRQVFEACPERRDLICPAEVLRQRDGSLACRAFRRRL